jgi:hypothetical protein
MINGKIKIFRNGASSSLESEVNEFLETIDIRQVIKTEYGINENKGTIVIYYVNFEDIRESKIDSILK